MEICTRRVIETDDRSTFDSYKFRPDGFGSAIYDYDAVGSDRSTIRDGTTGDSRTDKPPIEKTG